MRCGSRIGIIRKYMRGCIGNESFKHDQRDRIDLYHSQYVSIPKEMSSPLIFSRIRQLKAQGR